MHRKQRQQLINRLPNDVALEVGKSCLGSSKASAGRHLTYKDTHNHVMQPHHTMVTIESSQGSAGIHREQDKSSPSAEVTTCFH